jgi:hypothetical protein
MSYTARLTEINDKLSEAGQLAEELYALAKTADEIDSVTLLQQRISSALAQAGSTPVYTVLPSHHERSRCQVKPAG